MLYCNERASGNSSCRIEGVFFIERKTLDQWCQLATEGSLVLNNLTGGLKWNSSFAIIMRWNMCLRHFLQVNLPCDIPVTIRVILNKA